MIKNDIRAVDLREAIGEDGIKELIKYLMRKSKENNNIKKDS